MEYISTEGQAEPVSFATAALQGLAPDGGLYIPKTWPKLTTDFLQNIETKNLHDIGFKVARLFIDELSDSQLSAIIEDTLNFDTPLVHVDKGRYVQELFHGPTLAFKDFGARFMSRVFSVLHTEHDKDLVILAATSGDTGSAVAQGFLGVKGIKVCLLYPSGKVSHIQEQQLTTAGQNITALEVDGTFDDCQRMVKQAFSDAELNKQLLLSSANSINIARLVPQMFYFLYAVAQLQSATPPIFCVPSGNYGNLTAGLMAQKIGMPANGFIAATNANDIVPNYLKTGKFEPKASKRTISNAMDVGNPSNFTRILHLFGGEHQKIRNHLWGASFSDPQTRATLKEVYNSANYLLDPHTAVGYRAVEQYSKTEAGYFGEPKDTPFIILSTAHPAKFKDVIEPVIDETVPIPERLAQCLEEKKQSIPLDNNYPDLKEWLLENYR